jgi:hypothetical protein
VAGIRATRRQVAVVEQMEGRTLLSAISEFPIPTASSSPASITTGPPGGNLGFTESSGSKIGQINPATHAIAEFPVPLGDVPSSITAGPDGNLWFTEELPEEYPGQLGEVVLVPSIGGVVSVTHSKKEITAIILGVSVPLNPASASNRGFYSLDSGIKKRHTLVFSKPAKIRAVLYDSTADTVTLKLAQPSRGPLQVMVHAGVMATDGTSTRGNFTDIVS